MQQALCDIGSIAICTMVDNSAYLTENVKVVQGPRIMAVGKSRVDRQRRLV